MSHEGVITLTARAARIYAGHLRLYPCKKLESRVSTARESDTQVDQILKVCIYSALPCSTEWE